MSHDMREFAVDASYENIRLLRFVQQVAKDIVKSRSLAHRAIKNGLVQLNGQVAEDARILHQGDVIAIDADQIASTPRLTRGIVYESDEIRVIEKDAGVSASDYENPVAGLRTLYALEKSAYGFVPPCTNSQN